MVRVLTNVNQIVWQNRREREALRMITDRNFLHTRRIDPDLLNSTGIITDFQFIFRALGWENAWRVNEDGCKELIIEILCTLQLFSSHCMFRMFNEEFSYT